MHYSVNKVIIIGNVTRDPDVRTTQSGQKVCTFGVATNREWITSDGRRNESAEFHECVGWQKVSDICEKYVRKGDLVYIEGYLKTRSWDTPEGIRKFKTEVVIEKMIRLTKHKNEEGDDDYENEGMDYDHNDHDMDYDDESADESETETEDHTSNDDYDDQDDQDNDDDNLIDKDLGL